MLRPLKELPITCCQYPTPQEYGLTQLPRLLWFHHLLVVQMFPQGSPNWKSPGLSYIVPWLEGFPCPSGPLVSHPLQVPILNYIRASQVWQRRGPQLFKEDMPRQSTKITMMFGLSIQQIHKPTTTWLCYSEDNKHRICVLIVLIHGIPQQVQCGQVMKFEFKDA